MTHHHRANSEVWLREPKPKWNHFKVLLLEHLAILAKVNVQQDGRGGSTVLHTLLHTMCAILHYSYGPAGKRPGEVEVFPQQEGRSPR